MNIQLAFALLTRFPIPVGREIKEADLASSTVYFPLVGLGLGFLAFLVYYSSSFFFPVSVSIILAFIFMYMSTGFLHLDGFMDTLDGLGCGGDGEKKLFVMRDSRVGAFGVAGTGLLFLLKFLLLWELAGGGNSLLPLFISMPVASRLAMVLLMYGSSYPRRQGGLGKAYVEEVSFKHVVGATMLALLILYFSLGPFQALYTLLGMAVLARFSKVYFHRQIGGVTGDILGFTNESSEILFLLLIFLY